MTMTMTPKIQLLLLRNGAVPLKKCISSYKAGKELIRNTS